MEVKYNNVTMDLKAAVKMIKKKKGMFLFVISSFIGAIDMDRKIKYFESFGDFSRKDLNNLKLQVLLNLWDNRH